LTAQRVIADNWSLQEVKDLLTKGPDPDDSPGIVPFTDPDAPSAPIPETVLAFEALFDLLTDIVLREQILVDDRYNDAWLSQTGPLAELVQASIISSHGFLNDPERFDAPRTAMLERLILNPTMARQQAENEAGYRATGAATHKVAGAAVWGGAGMLARAWVYDYPYTPHPLRRRLFERAGIMLAGRSAPALAEFQATVAQQREELYRGAAGPHALVATQLPLPPVPVLVLRQASSLTDVFHVARQLRDEFADVRAWLGRFQQALGTGEFEAIAKQRNELKTLTARVERALDKRKPPDGASLSLGLSLLKLTLKLDPRTWVAPWNRLQTQAHKLTFAPSGQTELRKLLGFFGEERSTVGLRTLEHFAQLKH
jgi:hypothetical protein